MHKPLALAVVLLALSASAASANIVIVNGGVPGNPPENVLLNSGTSGSTVLGVTNQTATSVTFKGLESLSEPSNGQARIEASDGGYTNLVFFLTNPTLGFTQAEFNLNAAANGMATITALDQFANVFTSTFAIAGGGQNFVNLSSNSGEFIQKVTISTNVNLADTRQFRLGGIQAAVPETATWGMMLLGFGMVGAGLRLGRRRPAVAP